MRYNIEQIKRLYIEKYDLTEAQADNMLVFCQRGDDLVIGMAFCDTSMQDQNFYLFDAYSIYELNNMPIAQIKFMDDNKPAMFIRRLEFIDEQYKGRGYATALIKCFEKYCIKNGFELITGELIPLHNEPLEKVIKFYKANNFICDVQNPDERRIYKRLKTLEKEQDEVITM